MVSIKVVLLFATVPFIRIASASPVSTSVFAVSTAGANTTAMANATVELALEKRQQLRTIELKLHCDRESNGDTSCPWKNVTLDMDKRYKHDCPNHALVAMAAQHEFCGYKDWDRQPDLWCVGVGESANHTWLSIPACCGRWVEVDDPFYTHYPYVINPDTGYEYPTHDSIWMQMDTWDYFNHWNYDVDLADHFYMNRHPRAIWRFAMMQEAWEFRPTGLFEKCQRFFPQTEDEYQYYMSNMIRYGIEVEEEKAKAIKDYGKIV